uniref:Snakin-2 n=1 Tax=Kalanchoe fedtschenkoi TaxID=63787 RepID=A0A7N0U2K4_KALFE
MAISFKLVAAALLVSFLVCHLSLAEEADIVDASQVSTTSYSKINCGGECRRRCALSRRPNLCHRACGTCCARCNCVPPGTSGNQKLCACYYNMTTHGGRRKCP